MKLFATKPTMCAVACTALSLSMPGEARAQPGSIVYLQCEAPTSRGRLNVWKISLDEEAQTAAMQVNSFNRTVRAIFTPDEVVFDKGTKTISRVDLSFAHRVGSGIVNRGHCRIVTPPKRAF